MSTRISVKLAEENLAKNPEEEANIFSKWFFMYLNSLFKKGKKFPIVEDDIPYPTEGRDKSWTILIYYSDILIYKFLVNNISF